MRLLVVRMFVANFVSIAVAKKRTLYITIYKSNRCESRSEKSAASQGRVTEVDMRRYYTVEVASFRGCSDKTALRNSRSCKYRRDNCGVIEVAAGDRGRICDKTDDTTVRETAHREGSAGKAYPFKVSPVKLDIVKAASGTIKMTKDSSITDMIR